MVGPTTGGPIDPFHLPWLVYTYVPDGSAQERHVGCNPNVIGYPFPPVYMRWVLYILILVLSPFFHLSNLL